MRYIVNLFTFLLTTFGGFHLYLNILSKDKITYESSIKILRDELTNNSLRFIFTTILILSIGFVINLFINWIKREFIHRKQIEEGEIRTQTELLSKRNKIRDEIQHKVFKTRVDRNSVFPLDRINWEYGELNIRNIKDPDLKNYWKYETFDFRDDGIELFDARNIMYRILIIKNSNGKWDAIHKGEKPKKGNYQRIENVICVDFIPYENIEYIDWSPSSYNSSITINCLYKYRKYGKHPFKETRYYIKTDLGYWRLDNVDRRNLKKFKLKEFLGIR